MITESKLKNGTLTLDTLPFATQATNVRLVPTTEEQGDPVETLSGDQKGADSTTTWQLVIEAIQDFDDPAGFVAFAFDNDGIDVPFAWSPSSAAGGVDYAGTVTVRAVEVGGPVNTRNTTEAEWSCVGTPVPTYRPIA